MINEVIPEAFYKKKIQEYSKKLHEANRKRTRIAWLRLFVALLTFFSIYATWKEAAVWLILAEAITGLAIFLFIVSKDADAKDKADNLQRLIDINNTEIAMLNQDCHQQETGAEFLPAHHAYAEDLDIFGAASIYQFVNRCTSQQGQATLAERLLSPLNKEQIEKEQEAVAELKNKTDFRQQLKSDGAANHITAKTENKISEWLALSPVFKDKKWSLMAIVFPFFTAGLIFLYISGFLSSALFYLIIFFCYIIAFLISSKISSTYEMLSRISAEIETLQKQLLLIEAEAFDSEKMRCLKQQLAAGSGKSTLAEIRKLYAILNRFDMRLNHFAFFFLNTLFLWDLQQLLSLNKWKQQNKASVANWFTIIAETEVSSSLATLAFNHPQWKMPHLTDGFFCLKGENIGHPLLPQHACVTNSFSLEGTGKIAIITGSNMGGKSTFLRSIGVNVVLALAGAPVCADSFSLSHIKLMSSMRVADNLSENVSTFYAELKKLKTIIEAVNNKELVFILLDEILRGTNSLDRHAGSVALLKQLIQKEAIAIVATHDVELAEMENEYLQAIKNYHFDVQAKETELYFDYKLKEGICQSMNASILMKNVGIEME